MIYEENDSYRKRSLLRHAELVRGSFFDDNLYTTQFKNPNNKNFFNKIYDNLNSVLGRINKNSFFYRRIPLISEYLQDILRYLKERGIVGKYYVRNSFIDDFGLFRFTIEFNPNVYVSDGIPFNNSSLGSCSEFNSDIGVSKSIGEFLERYELSVYREKDLKKRSVDFLKKSKIKYVDPKLLSIRQNPKSKSRFYFDESTNFLWTDALDLDGVKYLIPAQSIFWTYRRTHADFTEPLIRESNTNGGAGYFDLEKAIVSGIYEVVERDAFLRHWLSGIAPLIITEIKSEELRYIKEQASKLNFELNWYYTGNEIGIPSVVCMMKDKTGVGPYVSMGGSSGKSLFQAMINSFTEAQGLYSSIRDEALFKKYDLKISLGSDIGRMDRLRIWGKEEMSEKLKFFEGGKKVSFDELDKNSFSSESPKVELNILRRKIESEVYGTKIYYYEKKSDLLKKLGYKVVKVVITNMVNLYLREFYKPNFIFQNFKPYTLKNGEINNIPHPFP